jgi:flagella basal body P-ring formation protein FlgA
MPISTPSHFKSLIFGALTCIISIPGAFAEPGESAQAGQAVFAVTPAQEPGGNPAEEDGIVRISLRPKASVRGSEFTIVEVADIAPADSVLASQVGKIVVSRSPSPGYDQRVTSEIIRMVLHGKVKDVSKVQIREEAECIVKIASVRLDGETLMKAGKQHILRQLPWPENQIEITCTADPQARYVPIGVGTGPVLEVVDADNLKLQGIARVRIRVLVDDHVVYQAILSYSIKTFQDVVVASDDILRGEALSSENTTLERRAISDFSFGFFTDAREIYGKIARSNIRSGATLTRKLVQTPPVIGRKSLVDVVYKNGNVRISLKGMAEENGAPGDLIRVRNLSSHKQLWCQVVDSQTVQVTNAK